MTYSTPLLVTAPSRLCRLVLLFSVFLAFVSCSRSADGGQSPEDAQLKQLAREDSLALKVAVLPTLDALPLFVADELHLFEQTGCDIRLKDYAAHMDADTALTADRVQLAVSDLVRAAKMTADGNDLAFFTATNLNWRLLAAPSARVRQFAKLRDKMIAVTRFSATHMLTSRLTDSTKLSTDNIFLIQVNDVPLRLRMMQTHSMDLAWLPEPQASQADLLGANTIYDSRRSPLRLGAIVYRPRALSDSLRQTQLLALTQAYDRAVDTIQALGIAHFSDMLARRCHIEPTLADSLSSRLLPYTHVRQPRQSDVEAAKSWLSAERSSQRK